MVGLAGFEPAISWVPGELIRSQATRIVRTHRGLSSRPGYPTAPGLPPRCDVALALTLPNYPSTLLFLTKRLIEVIYAVVIFA